MAPEQLGSPDKERSGLCASCTHAKEIPSSKGTTFIRCELSFVDPRFPRYPALPVRNCAGYEQQEGKPPDTR